MGLTEGAIKVAKELTFELGTAYLEQKIKSFLERGNLTIGLIVFYTSRLTEPLELERLNEVVDEVLNSLGEVGKRPVTDANIIRCDDAEFDYALYPYTVYEELVGESLTIPNQLLEKYTEVFETGVEENLEVSEFFKIQSDYLNLVSSFTLAILTRSEKAQSKLKVIIPKLYDGLMEKLGNCPVFVKIVAIGEQDRLRRILKKLSELGVNIKIEEDKLIIDLKPSQIGRSEIYDALTKTGRFLGLL